MDTTERGDRGKCFRGAGSSNVYSAQRDRFHQATKSFSVTYRVLGLRVAKVLVSGRSWDCFGVTV